MKKSRKIIIGVVTGVIVCAIVGSLLGVFIPRLVKKSNINELVSEQVKPSEGKGNFLTYSTDQAITTVPYSQKLQSIEDFTKRALNTTNGFDAVVNGLVANNIIQFWKNYKDSAAYIEQYKDWEKSINEDWNNNVDSYKNQYGDNWEFYFQSKVLDPVGGNEDDWKRQKLIEKANQAFDDFILSNSYIYAKNQAGDDVITSYPTPLTEIMQKYLISPGLVNGTGGAGTRNNIVFQPSKNDQANNKTALALAKFQEFVFMEWVKDELPLITSMTLWKHIDPLTVNNNGYKYFNTELAEEIYSGNTATLSTQAEGDAGSSGDSSGGDSSAPTSQVGISAGYKWQAFPVKQNLVDSPTGETTRNATDKYLSFASKFNSSGSGTTASDWKTNYLLQGTNGGININVKYTDDSSTLYFIKLGGGSSSVFNTSYTQYAAGATYMFNRMLGLAQDTNVPKKPSLETVPIVAKKSGTEIMNNFMETTKPTQGYYVELPSEVKEIINDSTNATTGYTFKGLYNGVTHVTDTVEIDNTPFILTRNESGVHIIGIDRAKAISDGYKTKGYDGMINEMANTILWRYILTTSGMNGAEYLNNGFSSFDVPNEIKTYYTANRNELLFKYILKNEITPPAKPDEYIFSNTFTQIDKNVNLNTNTFKDYVNAWYDYKNYKDNIEHNNTVKSKIEDIQKTANSLTFKTFGETVIQNGIAAMQPYTRNVTTNAPINRTNSGYIDDTYGTYNSLALISNNNPTNLFAGYNETGLKQKLDAIKTQINNVYSSLKQEIGLKKLTYCSARYNQYLLIGSQNPTSTNEYADNCTLINNAVNDYITNNTNDIENVINTQRLLASANFDPSKSTAKHPRASSNKDDVIDITNLALDGAYSDPITMVATAPGLPASTTASNKLYVNYQLQKAMDIVNKVPNAVGELWQYQQGLNYDQLLTLARTKWARPLLKDDYAVGVIDFIKQVLGLKYAFDFNQDTGNYEFTKFKEYLIQQTEYNKKAAFVWVNTERNDLIENYETQTLDDKFSFKPYQVISNNDINGYIYQNAPALTQYKNPKTGQFLNTTTFNETSSRYIMAPVSHPNSTVPVPKSYIGFQGMVFESSSPSDLPANAKTALFNNNLYVYETDTAPNPVAKGSMYNIGSIQNLIKEIESNIYTWATVIKTENWLNSTFGIKTSGLVSNTSISQARKDIANLVNTNYGVGKAIEPSLFECNKASILSTGSSILNNEASKYFKDSDNEGTKASEVVFTQFNYDDVVKLFDTNSDNKLDDNDKGINWTYANTNGFLNTSAEAFFISAIQWFNTQSSYITTATNDAQKQQGKFDAYDRRLNNLFGKDMLNNYKKEN